MRVSNFNRFNYDLSQHTSKIAKLQKEISQDGISYDGEEGVRNTLIKLERDDNVSVLNQQINSYKSIQDNMNLYDTNLQGFGSSMERFRELMIQKETDVLEQSGIDAINQEMKSIIDFSKTLEDAKLNSYEDLYGNETELVTGNNYRSTRSFDESLITVNGMKISEALTVLLGSNDIDGLDTIDKKIDSSLTLVGVNHSIAQRQIDLKELQIHYEDKYLSDRGSIEGKITELNSVMQSYEAQMLMISKVQNLSLVNYL